jgi:hypothetical protein
MLGKSNNNTISIFASDCILDPAVGDAAKYFNLRKTEMNSVITDYLKKNPDFGVEIFCLQSDFDGFIFPSGQSPIKVAKKKRPYYVWIFGSKKLIGALNKNVPASKLESGILHSVAFADCTSTPIILKKYHGSPAKNDKITVESNNMKFDILADMSQTLQLDNVTNSIDSYKTSPYINLESISTIKTDSRYTHVFHLSFRPSTTNKTQFIELTMNNLPIWVENMSDDNGASLTKTCGIKYTIGGVYDAFQYSKKPKIEFEITK